MAVPLANLKLSSAPDGAKYNPFKYVPLKSGSDPVGGSDDTNTVKKTRAAKVAKNKLKGKNRKHKKHGLELPFNPMIESGTVYTLQGFSPDFDGNWLITQVTHTFTGKGGTKTSIELEKAITSY